MLRIFSVVLFLTCSLSCSAQTPLRELKLSNRHTVQLLDSAGAAAAIVEDDIDHYFERVTISEMSIQMKKPIEPDMSRAEWVKQYKAFLRADVEDFTRTEADFVAEVVEGMYKNTSAVANDLFPKTLKLIKTKGRHYGESVYYTRENCIVIPANELADRKRDAFTSTMYHELFHVYSRLNPAKQRDLYRLIGFERIGFKDLKVPDALAERVLYNPDGVDFAQKITLRRGDTTLHAIPVIYSNHVGYTPDKREFFGYVEFALYEIVPEGRNCWRVVTAPNGHASTLNINELPDFFRQIRNNTHYIIHPDEVLADNFSFLLRERLDPKVSARFSPEGKELLRRIDRVIKGEK